MDEDLGRKIEKITQLISNKDIAQNLGPLIQLFSGSREEKAPETAAESVSKPDPFAVQESILENIQENVQENIQAKPVANPLRSLLSDEMTSKSDARIDLLSCLKNFVSPQRQTRIDLCIRMLGLLKVAGGLKDDIRR